MPFGICCASEAFAEKQHEALIDLEGVESIADDVFVLGKGASNKEALVEHNKNLMNFLKRMSKLNINVEKVKLCLSEFPSSDTY